MTTAFFYAFLLSFPYINLPAQAVPQAAALPEAAPRGAVLPEVVPRAAALPGVVPPEAGAVPQARQALQTVPMRQPRF